MKRYIKFIPITIFVILSTIIILSSPIFEINMRQPDYFKQDFVNAEIVEVIEENLQEDKLFPGRYTGSQRVLVGLLEGTYQYEAFEIDNPLSNNHYVYVQKGDRVIASVKAQDEGPRVWIYNYKRDNTLYFIVGFFLVLLMLLGRKQGVFSVLSLIFTGIVVVFFMMPLIYRGYHPIIVSVVAVTMITIVSFLLISGVTYKTFLTIFGTLAGVVIAGIASYIFGEMTALSGVNMDKGSELVFVVQDYNIQIRGLMFSGILIASLGAVMDVTMSIVSAMIEVKKAKYSIKTKALFASGMTIGRDVMGTMSNTLILAFVGSSFNTVMLIWGYQMSKNQFMNIPFLGVEIVQGIAGSIGIILAVPITAFITSIVLSKDNIKI